MERRIPAISDSHPGYPDDSVSSKPQCIAGTSQQQVIDEASSAPESSATLETQGGALTPASSPISVNTHREMASRRLNYNNEGCLAALVPGGPVSGDPNSLIYNPHHRASLDVDHFCASSSSDSSGENSEDDGSREDEWWVLDDSDQDGSFSEEGNCDEIGDDGMADDTPTDRRHSDTSVNTGHHKSSSSSHQANSSHRLSSGTGGIHVSHVHLALGVSKKHSAANVRRRHRRKRYVESLRRSNVDLEDENSRLREFLAYLESQRASS